MLITAGYVRDGADGAGEIGRWWCHLLMVRKWLKWKVSRHDFGL